VNVSVPLEPDEVVSRERSSHLLVDLEISSAAVVYPYATTVKTPTAASSARRDALLLYRRPPRVCVSKNPSDRGSATAQQIDDQNNQPYNQQQVDQTSAHMQTETQKPQNQKHHKNCPKHSHIPLLLASTTKEFSLINTRT
jgi:hypothetical protein